MKKEKLEYFAYATVSALGVVLGVYVFIRYAFFATLPFFIAWCVAFAVRPMASRLGEATKLPVRVVSAVIGAVSVVSILTLIVGVTVYAAGEAWDFIKNLGDGKAIYEILKKLTNPLSLIFGDALGDGEVGEEIASAVAAALSDAARALVTFLTGLVSSVPRVVLFIVMSSIATVYFCLDLELVNASVRSLLPERLFSVLTDFKDRFLMTMLKYLRSYLILAFSTFIIMIFGFMIMKIPFAILLAFAVALLDALPLIGVGTVLVPWGIIELIFGSPSRGVGLIILFFVAWLIRQFLEPRIVGKSLGIHPIISLVLLYIGYSLFGAVGLLFVPVGSVVLEIIIKNRVKEK